MSEDFPLAGTASVGSADSHRSGNGDRAWLKGYRGAAARPQAVRGLPDAREKWVSEDFPRARGRGVARDFRFDQFSTLIGWPARKADTLATVASMRPPRASAVAQAMCGVIRQFLAPRSGLSGSIGSREGFARGEGTTHGSGGQKVGDLFRYSGTVGAQDERGPVERRQAVRLRPVGLPLQSPAPQAPA